MNSHSYSQARKDEREILPRKSQQFLLSGIRRNFIKWIQTYLKSVEAGAWLSETRG